MALETLPWNPSDHLDSEEMIVAYLEAALEDGDPALIAVALNNIAEARGKPAFTELSSTGDIATLVRAVKSLGLELTAKAA
jgi:probable addiction module antidote protein